MSNKGFSRPVARLIGLPLVALGLTFSALAGVAATRNRDQLQLVPAAFTPADPGFSTTVPLPKSRPDPALYFPADPVEITVPAPRPKIEDVLPKSTITIGEMIRQQTGRDSTDETTLTLKPGEGIAAVLKRGGYPARTIATIVSAMKDKVNLRRLQIGTRFQIAEHGFRFSVKSGRDIYVINHPDSGWLTLTAIRPVDTYMKFAAGVIDGSIYNAAMAAGVSESAFNDYVRVMGFSVDFQREIRAGDSFELLYEVSRDRLSGDAVGSKLLYAGLTLSGDKLGYFSLETDNSFGWYDENGNSAARTLIRTPISGARLSSSFGNRRHPVSGYNAMHKGVDFAAPRGTPIIAAGDGIIAEAGWKGSYGRYVRIRHNGTYDTAYAHMSRLAPGVSRGSRVAQGEVIGYVGSTGRVTGAHLHYEVMVNNRQVNPMTVRLPTGKRIDPSYHQAFAKVVERVDNELLSRGVRRFAQAD